MRDTFFNTLTDLAEEHRDVVILTADLGFNLFDRFKESYPERFYNMGVAEANMVSVAAGLSLCGKNVYCYSMVPFLVMRAFEQIRVDIAFHNLNVKLIGVGGGFTYGMEGYTHFGLEDLALMRSLPNMTIVVPSDQLEAKALAKLSISHKGPMYIRLGRTGEPCVHERVPDFVIGRADVLKEGKDVALFAVGNMVYTGAIIVDKLKHKGISASLINMHTLKPFDAETVHSFTARCGAIFSIEEHNINGGLGSCLAEVLAETGYKGVFKRIGITELKNVVGDAEHMRDVHGLSVDKICSSILETLVGSSGS